MGHYTTDRRRKSIGKTSSEVKNRWNSANYRRYTISLKRDEDAEIIDYLEKAKAQDKKIITQIFREGYEKIKNEGR